MGRTYQGGALATEPPWHSGRHRPNFVLNLSSLVLESRPRQAFQTWPARKPRQGCWRVWAETGDGSPQPIPLSPTCTPLCFPVTRRPRPSPRGRRRFQLPSACSSPSEGQPSTWAGCPENIRRSLGLCLRSRQVDRPVGLHALSPDHPLPTVGNVPEVLRSSTNPVRGPISRCP